MFRKPVIVFEGIEGSGKTFHINNISKYLKKKKLIILRSVSLVVALIQKKLEN